MEKTLRFRMTAAEHREQAQLMREAGTPEAELLAVQHDNLATMIETYLMRQRALFIQSMRNKAPDCL